MSANCFNRLVVNVPRQLCTLAAIFLMLAAASAYAKDQITDGTSVKAESDGVIEIVVVNVKPGTEKQFEAAVATAQPLFIKARGFRSLEVQRSVENPSRYRLLVKWDTIENHTVDFRGSEDAKAWRELVVPFFVEAPEVEHHHSVVRY